MARWTVGPKASLGVILTLALGAGGAGAQIPWDASAWRVVATESRVERHLGRDALYMHNGTAWLKGTRFRDGVVEFDVAAPASQGFHGIRLRAVDDRDSEHFYLRFHLSGKPDATQYNPVFHGVSGWQIYADRRYQLPVTIPHDRWVHVRAALRDRRLEVRVEGGPPLVYPHLVRDPVAGAIGLDASGAGAWFANVVVKPDGDPQFSDSVGAPAPTVPADVVTRWRISEPFAESVVDGVTQLPRSATEGRHWTELGTEDNGVANLARLAGVTENANTVFAAVTLRSDGARTVPVAIGFSDRVRLFVNGRQIYAGNDRYASRDYRFLGTVGFYDTVFLPLKAGENQVWLAVSEDFGGWAAAMRVPAGSGVVVVP